MKAVALAGCVATALYGLPAQAGDSIYTDLSRCTVHDTGNDEFINLCKGPDGLAAVLHYFDGRAITIFGKGGGKGGVEIVGQPFNEDEPISVGGSGKVFGPKIEWVRSDSGKVCAAIVRVSTDKGSRLVTTALVGNAGRVSMSKTNEQALADARKACGASSAAASPSAKSDPEGEVAVASTAGAATTTSSIERDVSAGVKRGLAGFDQVYKIEGISGAIDRIQKCYAAAKKRPSVANVAECAAMDIMAANVDGSMSRKLNMPHQEFFSESKIDNRIASGVKNLKLSKSERAGFGALVMKLTEASL